MVNINVFLSEQKSDYLINVYQKIFSIVLTLIQLHTQKK